MENEQPDESNNDMSSTAADWESRTLCSDGNCIGVIGPDGLCKECGLPYDGPTIEGQTFEADDYDDDDDYGDEDDETSVVSEASHVELKTATIVSCHDVAPAGRSKSITVPQMGG